MDLERELDEAQRIVRQAGDLALQYFARPSAIVTKPDGSPVTEADRECERLIGGRLADLFPLDGICGEEGSYRESRSGRRWLIDPIDGTRDFVRGTPFWAIQLALEVDTRVALGIVYLPCSREVLHATAGAGCFYNQERVRASSITRLAEAVLLLSGFQGAWNIWSAEDLRRLTQECWTVRGYGACYDIVMIARGLADIWLSGNGMPWDYAPAHIIARECGADFLTRDGSGRIDALHAVVCAPGLKRAVCTLLGMPG